MNSSQRIGIVGAGSWGTALSLHLADKGYTVDLWVYEPDLCKTLFETRENPVFLPGFPLSPAIHPSNDIQKVVRGKSLVLLVVPSHVIRQTVESFKEALEPDCLILNAGKGIENETLLTIHQILKEVLPGSHRLATLSGPTFAVEIAKKIPSAIVAASDHPDSLDTIQEVLSADYLKVFTSPDVLGVELGGALKNVIAIATGISDGLKLGFNTRAALITRGLVEITRIGTALGARPETFSGLSGMGDLVLTCTGDLSRNRSVGLKLAEGLSLKEITSGMSMVAEGIHTVTSAYNLKNKLKIQASIIEETYNVVHQGKNPKQALLDLMNVEIGSEFSGIKGL